jgi:hypothetical protein
MIDPLQRELERIYSRYDITVRTVEPEAPPAPTPTQWIFGVDFGQANDSTATTLLKAYEVDQTRNYDVANIQRIPLGTKYPVIVDHIGNVIRALQKREEPQHIALVADFTGVGRPIVDLLIDANLPITQVIPVTITGADTETRGEDGSYRVPKRNLASTVQVLLQSERLRFSTKDPLLPALKDELVGFRAKVKLNGHTSYEAGEDWRSAKHDDLVLALAMACWWGEEHQFSFSGKWVY